MAPKKKQLGPTRTGRSRAEWRQSGSWIVFVVSVVDLLLDPAKIWRKAPPKVDVDRASRPQPNTSDPGMRQMEARFKCSCEDWSHLQLANSWCGVPSAMAAEARSHMKSQKPDDWNLRF